MKYIIEQQTILFYRRILRGSNVVLRSLLHQKVGYEQSLLSKFNIQSLSRPRHELKLYIRGPIFKKSYEKLRMNLHKTYDQRNKKNAIPPK